MVWRDMEGHGLQEICFNHRVEARCSVLLLIDGAHFYSSKYRLKADFFFIHLVHFSCYAFDPKAVV